MALNSVSASPDRVCWNCLTEENNFDSLLKRCSRCKTALYCSVVCQKAAFSEHKKSCLESKKLRIETDSQLKNEVMEFLNRVEDLKTISPSLIEDEKIAELQEHYAKIIKDKNRLYKAASSLLPDLANILKTEFEQLDVLYVQIQQLFQVV